MRYLPYHCKLPRPLLRSSIGWTLVSALGTCAGMFCHQPTQFLPSCWHSHSSAWMSYDRNSPWRMPSPSPCGSCARSGRLDPLGDHIRGAVLSMLTKTRRGKWVVDCWAELLVESLQAHLVVAEPCWWHATTCHQQSRWMTPPRSWWLQPLHETRLWKAVCS